MAWVYNRGWGIHRDLGIFQYPKLIPKTIDNKSNWMYTIISSEETRQAKGDREMKNTDTISIIKSGIDVSKMREQDIDYLEEELELQRREIYANKLRAIGFNCRTRYYDEAFSYILVFSPIKSLPNAWATIEEAKRLIDTARNLSKEDAYQRWYYKTDQEIQSLPYTEEDARRDTREARSELKQSLNNGEINGSDYASLYQTTSFMDLAR